MSVNLANLLPEVRRVNIGRGEVEVYSLDLSQVGVLLSRYGTQLEALFPSKETLGAGESHPDFSELVAAMPSMIEDIIVMGLHAEGQEDLAIRIPLSAKIEILTVIWELSVHDPKKLVAKLTAIADNLKVFVGPKG